MKTTGHISSQSQVLARLSEAAEGGDAEAGIELMRLFAETGRIPGATVHPVLVAHVARCIGRIVNDGMEPREALCIKRKAHRQKDTGAIAARNEAALLLYCQARADDAKHEDAMEKAAKEAGVSESAMRHLYEDSKLERLVLAQRLKKPSTP
ncbi:MAG: hypothetical protein Q8L56_03500 [Rhodocyclaceae bacterium]|nr:hypothetical protein [Rhodocyclaceae bacterium]